MFNFGNTDGQSPPSAVIDVTDAEFMDKVIEESRTRPVIVDFWAPWCEPCKQLGPELEKAVQAKKGKVLLAKVNIDEQPMIAQQLRVQSIPAVFGFVDGQPVDGFMGALPGSQIQYFVEKLAKQGGDDSSLDEMTEAANAALAEGAVSDAAQVYAAILSQEPTELRAIAGLARCYVANGDLERARQTLAMAPPDKQGDPVIAAVRAAIDLAEESSAAAPQLDELRRKVAANGDDHQSRYDLSLALVAAGDRDGAVDELLELFRRDREWREGAAKIQLLKLFEAFGPTDPLARSGRRRLTSMIFA